MNTWDRYLDRTSVKGTTMREVSLNKEKAYVTNKITHSLSYFTVQIDNMCQNVAIVNTDNLNTKYIYSLPDEDIRLGSLVFWNDNYWLITEKDFATEVYTKAEMIQCNHLLKWIDSDGVIHEQWCIVEDGTKYLTGEFEDRNFIVTRGDSRLGLMIAKNEDTVKFNRESRFLIDDEDAEIKTSYTLTKPLKVGWQFGGTGVYKFVLAECNSEDDDNHALGIANYYKYFPRELEITPTEESPTKKKVWI